MTDRISYLLVTDQIEHIMMPKLPRLRLVLRSEITSSLFFGC
jgi:hypothetical protein